MFTVARKVENAKEINLSEVVVSDILAGHFVDSKVTCLSVCAH